MKKSNKKLLVIIGLIAVVFQACMAGIGNSIVVESKEKNYKDLNKFTFIITWIAGFCSVCLLCIIFCLEKEMS